MPTDYPDWQRAFRIVGVDVTLNVDITAASVTIPVSIQTQAVTLNVNLTSSSITLNVNLAASAITLNVNLSSQTANINISFEDQSVAVFDAAKWFAHNAQQIFVNGGSLVTSGSEGAISRTVPAGKTFFLTGLCGGFIETYGVARWRIRILIASVNVIIFWANSGQPVIFDVPLRATAGQVVQMAILNQDTTSETCDMAFWGYDE